ncbi:hypothetical protein BS333_03970 [Vibrio azureus]|uniref:Carrier domain-containing protein n=1 Tax=Vibrio azureus NBRC 104587 TaxID=1219077 RepID=U3AUG7_9VIBR|nr:acyl carrier protein [Vibrio azureus]AUI85591.1 hypothetical protein BS333_03970 [Vibrio azureus]GAD77395.1 hypothetical protein VAZ01S_073_00280 [Vibrio azureus NBRC 104587]
MQLITQSKMEAWLLEYLMPTFHQNNLSPNVNTSFDALGLDSMTRVQLVTALEDELGVELDPVLGFEYPTIASLCKQVESMQEA